LHSITGYTDLLGRTDLDEEQLLYLTNISRAVHTIQLITRQVLDFSRMERSQGELEARPTNVDIRDMVQGLSSMPEERSSEAKHVALNVFVDPQCPKTAFVDETYLTRVSAFPSDSWR
jgi:signal transduction histidine kinase